MPNDPHIPRCLEAHTHFSCFSPVMYDPIPQTLNSRKSCIIPQTTQIHPLLQQVGVGEPSLEQILLSCTHSPPNTGHFLWEG